MRVVLLTPQALAKKIHTLFDYWVSTNVATDPEMCFLLYSSVMASLARHTGIEVDDLMRDINGDKERPH